VTRFPYRRALSGYKVDTDRVDGFFNALSCGIVFKACGKRLPAQYSIEHVYHNFWDLGETPEEKEFKNHLQSFYSGKPIADPMKQCLFGHDFFGVFRA
jgi:hypothetical protein